MHCQKNVLFKNFNRESRAIKYALTKLLRYSLDLSLLKKWPVSFTKRIWQP